MKENVRNWQSDAGIPHGLTRWGTTTSGKTLKRWLHAGRLMLMTAGVAMVMAASAVPIVSNVRFKQRYPWNGLVDITFDVTGVTAEEMALDKEEEKITWFVVSSTNYVDGVAERRLTMRTFLDDNGEDANFRYIAVTNGSYHYVWVSTDDLIGEVEKIKYGTVKSFVTTRRSDALHGKKLWAHGIYWADRNVGAENPEEYGDYFYWGDTNGCRRISDNWIENKTGKVFWFSEANCKTYGLTKDELYAAGVVDTNGVLTRNYDAAQIKWARKWRMPTVDEIKDLVEKCTWEAEVLNGTPGFRVTGKEAYSGQSIFLPATGYGVNAAFNWDAQGNEGGRYWSSSVDTNNVYFAHRLYFKVSSLGFIYNGNWRHDGRPIRPVAEFDEDLEGVDQ